MSNILTTIAQIDLTAILNQEANGNDFFIPLEIQLLGADLTLLNAIAPSQANSLTLPSTGQTFHVAYGAHNTYNTIDLSASTANNIVVGGNDGNHIIGGSGNDILIGGNGNDILEGSGGSNTLYADAGNDQLYGGNENVGPIVLNNVTTTLNLIILPQFLFGGSGNDVLVDVNGNLAFTIGHSNVSMIFGLGGATLVGGTGTDQLYGENEHVSCDVTNSTITFTNPLASAPNNLYAGSGAHDLLAGCSGYVNFSFTSSIVDEELNFQSINLYGGNGGDTLIGENISKIFDFNSCSGKVIDIDGANYLQGGAGDDLLIGSEQTLTFLIDDHLGSLPASSFTIMEHVFGNSTLISGGGNDVMIGDAQSVNISAGVTVIGGNNTLIAGTGNNMMWGAIQTIAAGSHGNINYGQDTFEFNLTQHLGNDVINDMNVAFNHGQTSVGQDILEFIGGAKAQAAVNAATFTSDGHGGTLAHIAGGTIDFADIAYTHQTHMTQITHNIIIV